MSRRRVFCKRRLLKVTRATMKNHLACSPKQSVHGALTLLAWCTMLPCTVASDIPGSYGGLQLAVPSHRRELQTAVSTSADLTSALANTAVGHIVLASGTYNLISELSITRSVILEAAAGATVTLDAQASSSNERRVLNINPGSSGVVQLKGLRITGGYITYVRAHVQKFPSPLWENCSRACFDSRLGNCD